MRTLLGVLVIGLMAVIGIAVYNVPYSPCNTPLTYKIGTMDPKFNFSDKEILVDTEKAVLILNSAYGKRLFTYASESGLLTINFIYDQRSALNKDVNEQQKQLDKKDVALQKQVENYENDITVFKKKLAVFNETVQQYNKQGGAPREVYLNLINQQNQLQTEGDKLNQRAKQLSLETQDYNLRVENLNQDIEQFNLAIEQKPEEGQYNGTDKTITIYFANDKNELVHLLAHEFGHALGMDHVNNEKAIMYPYTSSTLEMTTEDKQQLETVCKEIPLPQYWIEKLREKIIDLKFTLRAE